MLKAANAAPKKDELGSKSINSLTLQKINKDNGGNLFFTPEQISIPMGIPIKFNSLESKKYGDIQKLFNVVDTCDPTDLDNIEKIRQNIMELLSDVYISQDKGITEIVAHIQK